MAPSHISFWEIRESPSLSSPYFPGVCGWKYKRVTGPVAHMFPSLSASFVESAFSTQKNVQM